MIYSTNYYGYEPERAQAAPIQVLTDATHPIPANDERLADITWWSPGLDERFHGRVASAWWGFHPHLALPDAPVTVAISGNFTIQVPDFAARCLAELGDDDFLVMRHPWRDDILDEAYASLDSWRWNDGRQRVVEQAESYIAQGHPRNWGLFHGGMVVRRDTPAMRAFNEAWWEEYCTWSSQNQVSLPFLLGTMGVKWHAWPDVGEWHAQPFEDGWVTWGNLGRVA